MALKEKLLENKRLNEENQFKVAEQQSKLSYQLGYADSKDRDVDYNKLYDPFIKEFADLQIHLQNGTSQSPTYDRKRSDDIINSVSVIQDGLSNVLSNTEIWDESVQLAGKMAGVDLMGTPQSRFRALNVLSDNLPGIIEIKAVDNDINKLAWEIYDEDGFVERIFINKLNKLSETQDMFIIIPDTSKENQDFKNLSSEIFESKDLAQDQKVLTGGVTETYREKDNKGQLKLITKDLKGGMVQDFYIIDKEAISNSMQFNTEMDKISAGILGQYDGFDQVIAFNNNILSEVTDYYIKPGKALKENEKKKFQEDYKKWFLEKEIGKEFPLGDPKPKQQPKQEEEVVEEQVQVEEQIQS